MKVKGGCLEGSCMLRGGHLFDFDPKMWDSTSPLSCHRQDCVMNVFALLGILEKHEAFNIASKSKMITNRTILHFLDNMFHVKHEIIPVFELPDEPDDIPIKLMDTERALLRAMDVNTALIAGVRNHLVIVAKERGLNNEEHIYLYDPQNHLCIPLISYEMARYAMDHDYIDIYISKEEPVRRTKQIQHLKRSAMLNRYPMKNISLKQRSAPNDFKSKNKSKNKTKTKTKRQRSA